jgi:hypothetical protein
MDGDGANETEGQITTSATTCSIRDAVADTYMGGKTSMELLRFMLEQPEKPVLIVHDRVALERVVATNPFVVLVVVDGTDTQPYFDAISLAQVDTEASSTYCVSANRSLLDAVVRIPPALFVFRDFGATRAPYTGVWKKSVIVAFLQANKYSVLSTYTSAHSGYFYDKTATAHVLLFTSNSGASASYNALLRAQMAQLAVPYTAAISGMAPGVILRFIEVPAHETTLRDALFATRDRDLPMLLVVDDMQAPPLRVPLFGTALVKALQTSAFVDTVGALLAQKYPPVFKTMEIVDENEDGVDDATQPGAFESAASFTVTKTVTTRELREVTIELQTSDQAVSPWEIYKQQQQARVENVTNADWILGQQQQSRDVVVCFSSPRCYACRAFATVLAQVAAEITRLSDGDASLRAPIFASVNVDVVAISSLSVQFTQLPSLFLFPRSSANGDGIAPLPPVAFSQRSFTLEEVLAFVHANVELQ